ncbi:hypothetical protein D3C80_1776550 [compost metagenome]
MRDQVTFAADGLEYLVEIGFLAGGDLENVFPAGTLQRLEDGALFLLVDKGADLLDAFRDKGCWANGLRKTLEIKLILRAGQAVRVVERKHAAFGR